MLIHDDKKYIIAQFESEEELENVVVKNAEFIFGPSSFYLPKTLIKTTDGAGTIPDGFAFDISGRQWFIVEAELGRHSVWLHIAPQVAKQITASMKADTKRFLVERTVTHLREDSSILEKFEDEGIQEIDIRKVLADILDKPPILGMPIDSVSADLKEWAETLKVDVRLWIVRKYTEFGNSKNVMYEIPEEYRPVFDTEDKETEQTKSQEYYDVNLSDLLSSGMIKVGDVLIMSYKPRDLRGDRKVYKAVVQEDGTLKVGDQTFSSPSYAAIYFIQQAGSTRKTVNGWTSWKTNNGKLLADLREQFLNAKKS